jgi:hypothetical protein
MSLSSLLAYETLFITKKESVMTLQNDSSLCHRFFIVAAAVLLCLILTLIGGNVSAMVWPLKLGKSLFRDSIFPTRSLLSSD